MTRVEMVPVLLALSGVCLLGLVLLVFAEWAERSHLRVASKLVASAAFVAIGAIAAGDASYERWMLAGLVLGAVGDAALLGRGDRWFLVGLVAFLCGHVAYVVGFAQLVAPARWLSEAGLFAALPAAAGAIALAWLWPRLGSMRGPVIVYVAVIVAMVIGAIAVVRTAALPPVQRLWLAQGAVLFFLSDLAVAREKFVARAFVNRLVGLPAYYAGQVLIAWSLT